MSEIIHKTEPIEHWIVDGKAYRLATEADVDKFVYRSDVSIEQAMEATQERLASVWAGDEFRFECRGFRWLYAYIQDDSLLQPNADADLAEFEVKCTPTAKPIDWTKPVRTKDGRAVRVLCTDGPGEYPVVGFIDGSPAAIQWTLLGEFIQGYPREKDLENVPQRIQREYWVNVYAEKAIASLHYTRIGADASELPNRLACVKITIDCEEGEGL